MIRRSIIAFIIMLLFPACRCIADDNLKYPSQTKYKYINDYTNTLNSSTVKNLTGMGCELYELTKAEVVVVLIDKIEDGYSIEEYANGLFREWGIGDKKLNNGLLILVAVESRTIRIEVGYGLEGPLPDALTNRIQQKHIIPYFTRGDYDSGIIKGYTELCTKVAEEYGITLSKKTEEFYSNDNKKDISAMLLIILFLIYLAVDGFIFHFRISHFLLVIFLNSRFKGGRSGFGGGSGGFGGFGGGSSGGGGSTGRW
jgi:uncharacterized protein